MESADDMVLNLFYKDNEHEEDTQTYSLGYLTQYSYGIHNFKNHINTDTYIHTIYKDGKYLYQGPASMSDP